MTFAYGMNAVDTIKKYEVMDDQIIVTSLTDVKYSVSLKDEHILIKTMIEQAKSRNEKVNFIELKNNLKKIKSRIITEIGIITINAGVPIINRDYDEIMAMFQFVVVLSSILLTLDIKDFIEDKKEYEELEKYRIFFNIKEDLKKLSFVLCGLKKIPTENININTIDNYSLKNMKEIRKNLEQIKNSFNDISSNEKIIKLNKK